MPLGAHLHLANIFKPERGDIMNPRFRILIQLCFHGETFVWFDKAVNPTCRSRKSG